MTQRRPGQRPHDPENEVATMAPDVDDELPLEPLTLRDPTLEVERVPLRPKPKRPPKKGAGAMAWIVAALLIGGIGAAVALVMTGGVGGGPTTEVTTAAAEADTSTGSDDVAEAAAADASEPAGDDAAAVAGEPETEEAAEVQVAAVEETTESAETTEAAEDVTVDEVQVAAVDDVGQVDETTLAEADSEAASDDVVIASDDVAVPSDDVVQVAAADVAQADGGAPQDVVAPADVVVARAPNPAEAKRLNDLGFAARKAGDHATATARYREAVQADPESVWARYNLACELALAGDSKGALNELVAIHKLATPDAKKALAAARKDSDFESLRDLGQFVRLTR